MCDLSGRNGTRPPIKWHSSSYTLSVDIKYIDKKIA